MKDCCNQYMIIIRSEVNTGFILRSHISQVLRHEIRLIWVNILGFNPSQADIFTRVSGEVSSFLSGCKGDLHRMVATVVLEQSGRDQ